MGYEHQHRSARRLSTKTHRTVTIKDLAPGTTYIFNIVARSLSTGQSAAYLPVRHFASGGQSATQSFGSRSNQKTTTSSREVTWADEVAPFVLLAVTVGCIFYTRPCCKGGFGQPIWNKWELELPNWQPKTTPNYNAMSDYRSSGYGSYAPPSVVGMPSS